jgi:hypothetical protein
MLTAMKTMVLASLIALAAALPAAAVTDGGSAAVTTPTEQAHPLVCMTAPTGPLAGPAIVPPLPPIAPSAIRSTIGVGAPTTGVPGTVLLPPQPQTGAYVLPTQTTTPSLPGVTLPGTQVLVPPLPTPGANRTVVATGLVQAAVGPSAAQTMCY